MNYCEGAVTLVIGLGEVGKPLYSILHEQNLKVIGIDIDPIEVNDPVGILHVCFPFKSPEQFQNAVVDYADKYAPEIIVVNSTVVPGTTRAIEAKVKRPCVYSPVRGKHVCMANDMKSYVKFIAGANAGAVEKVRAHLTAAGLKQDVLSKPETLELAKLLETTYFGVLIAWAQEMNRFAEAVQADYMELGSFFREINYLPNVLFQPGVIGGHCVMPNIALLEQQFKSCFLSAVKYSNEARKKELDIKSEIEQEARLQPLSLN
jgi:UDP-N-acetyl-D-mannosaminuronate dehydrogenase